MATQKYTKNGDYILKKLNLINFEGKSIDITNIFTSIDYFESIYENFISGTLSINEPGDILQFFPLIGEERIEFSYSTSGEKDIDHKFYVYRIQSSDPNDKVGMMKHTLFFVSEEAMKDQSTLVSKSFKGKESKTIVENLFLLFDSKKKLNIESTKGLHHVVFPNWSPSQCINWLSSFTQHPTNVGGSFLFFQNSEGFNFKSFESLLEQKEIDKFSYTIQNLATDEFKSTDNQTPYNNPNGVASVIELSGSADTLKFLSYGMYANKYIAYDSFVKKIKEYKYDYKTDFSKTKHLNEFRLNTDKFQFNSNQQRVSIIASSSLRDESTYFKSKEKSFSTKLEETAPFRTSIYAQTTARQFEVVFYGNDKITAGKVVEIKMPNTTSLDQKKNDPHKFNNKRFLITECSHSFGETSHRITTRCISDSSINKFVYELPLKQE